MTSADVAKLSSPDLLGRKEGEKLDTHIEEDDTFPDLYDEDLSLSLSNSLSPPLQS